MIELEKAAIDNAPVVKVQMGQVLRCHLCGQPIIGEAVEIERLGEMRRIRGACCGPA